VSEILITGGNGFVGRHLVRALRVRGDAVRVLALPGEDTAELEQRGVVVYRGDVRRLETLGAPMAGADCVVHLAAMMDVWRPLRDYQAVNVSGTANVCRAALDAGVERLVHMSSSSVYGIGLGRPVDESSPLSPFRDPYPITKAAADTVVQRMIAEERLPAVILRPDQIFGAGDHVHFGRIADRLQAGRSIIVGMGGNALPLVHVSDVVHALLLVVERRRAVGNAYNITTAQPLTQYEMLQTVAGAIGVRPPRIHVPYRALYAAGCLAERLAAHRGLAARPAITRLGVAFFGTDNRFSIDKARREIGYRPELTVEAGLRLTAEWYQREQRARGPATLTSSTAIHQSG
jgi:nucleoside-diphosphate-sugar epimerase